MCVYSAQEMSCTGWELRVFFIFLNAWKESKEECFMTCENYITHIQNSPSIILFEHIHLICLCVVSGCKVE